MLKDNLYLLVSLDKKEEGNYEAAVTLNPDHAIFRGHFPEQPVLPGVCLLEITKELLSAITKKACRLRKAAQIKYLKVVDPTVDAQLRFELAIEEDGQGYKVNAGSFLSDGSANFKLKGLFT